MDMLKKFSPAFYGIIILCFLLPFVNLSCGGQKIMSLTGFQLISGSEVKADGMFGDLSNNEEVKEKKEVDPQPFALFALLAAVLGLGLSLLKSKMIALSNTLVSVLGFIFLIILKINLDGDAELGGQNVITLDYQLGYWITLLLFIGAAIVQWLLYREA